VADEPLSSIVWQCTPSLQASSFTSMAANKVLATMRRGQVLYELENPRTNLGRAPTNDIVLDSQSVSKNHCVIEFNRDGMACLRDLQSRNGTFINAERIQNAEVRLLCS
jgi:predicted component of type VI protein secretion system